MRPLPSCATKVGREYSGSPALSDTMTNGTTPIQAAFELQRESIKQGQQLFEQSLDIQQNAAETFLHNSLSIQRAAQRQGTELSRQLFDAQLDAFESALDEGEVRGTIDRQFEEGTELTQELLNAQFEQSADFVQQLANAQFGAFESALDDEFDVRAALDQQFDDLNETQQEAWDEFEREFSDAFDDLSDQQKKFVAQSVEAVLNAQRETEQQTLESVRQAEDVAETTRGHAKNLIDEAGDAAEQQVETQAQAQTRALEQLEDLEGLGATYADRLQTEGIESVADLAEANAETIADATDVSEDLAEEWIETARGRAQA